MFVNLGACIRDLEPDDAPSIEKCHISFRLERVCPPEYFEAIRSASPEGAPPDFMVALEGCGLPWLEALSTRAGVQALLRSSPTMGLVSKAAP